MARTFLTPIDLAKNELQNARVQNLAAAPSSPVAGQVYHDTVLLASYIYNGSAWVSADASKLSGTIPNTALTTNPLARANHTGTQLAATISDFATTAQGYHLNQFAVPTANIAMGGFKLTGLSTTPNASGDSAEYSWVLSQVQSAAAGISSKDPVNAVAISNVASLSGTTTIDGVSLVAGNRVLLTAQTTTSQNGPWVIAAGAWTRPVTEGTPAELDFGAMWLSLAGTTNAGTQWRMSAPTTGAITVGTTAITIVQFGAGASYTAGNGITLTGSAFSVTANTGISVSGSGVAVDFSVVPKKFSTSIGDGSTTALVVTHGLGTQDVIMQVRQVSSPYSEVECDMAATSTTTSTFTFATAPTSNQYRVTVIG